MTLPTHTCAATGCQHAVSLQMLMCIDHWRMVPKPIRDEVLATWRLRRLNPGSAVAISDHGEAVAKAVAAVEEKQIRKAQSQAGPSGSLFT